MGEGESRLLDSLVLGAYKTTVQTATTDISRPTTKGECVGGWVVSYQAVGNMVKKGGYEEGRRSSKLPPGKHEIFRVMMSSLWSVHPSVQAYN